ELRSVSLPLFQPIPYPPLLPLPILSFFISCKYLQGSQRKSDFHQLRVHFRSFLQILIQFNCPLQTLLTSSQYTLYHHPFLILWLVLFLPALGAFCFCLISSFVSGYTIISMFVLGPSPIRVITDVLVVVNL